MYPYPRVLKLKKQKNKSNKPETYNLQQKKKNQKHIRENKTKDNINQTRLLVSTPQNLDHSF